MISFIRITSTIQRVLFVEDHIASLEEELDLKKKELGKAIDNAQELTDRIYSSLDMRNGLCIRCLTKPLLGHVLSYLGGTQSNISIVCKYWYHVCKEYERPISKSTDSLNIENLSIARDDAKVVSNGGTTTNGAAKS